MSASLLDRVICIDPGHGGTGSTDFYRVGPAGEREEWINLRVAKHLQRLLTQRGARVVLTRTEDVHIPLDDRAHTAMEVRAEAFLSIHHNATADRSVNFPIIYFHGMISQNMAGVKLAHLVGEEIRGALFDGRGALSICSDYTIFPRQGAAVLRGTHELPAVLGEASFFSNAEEEARLKSDEYNRLEAEAYVRALERFFGEEIPLIEPKSSGDFPPPFTVFEQADRMRPEAIKWRENFEHGKYLAASDHRDDWQRALELLTLSAKSFPDSPVARGCHLGRAELLEKLGEEEEGREERKRAREFYFTLDQEPES